MTKITLYAVLWIASLAMILLVTGFVGWRLGWPGLAVFLYPLAGHIMLLAFSLLLLLGCGLFLRALYRELVVYFHGEAAAVRRLAMLRISRHHAVQRRPLERDQIQYLYELKRQRLLTADNKKHSRALFKAISAELRHSVEPDRFRTLQRHLKQHRSQVDPQAMLALRERVLCRSSSAG
ncbi:hypothetical protein NP590_19535 [Methylomonas sp. SURF-2]|uniref:HemY N-terminal domain-containing protein n=1 Tax=Methylomonas subterranea TaxID=2952225 RepID=A0ABT1TM62_9GAMM|nr:hypothetical protein [Methylomonas sp. SURF-2]MCQ8106306.1 hypothetical protein [Methylomonas sp. SURF-2]